MRYQNVLLSAVLSIVFAACSAPPETTFTPGPAVDAGIPTTVTPRCTSARVDGGEGDAGTADAGQICTCPEGYQLDGRLCRLVDECVQQEVMCGTNAECVPLVGSHKCVCKDGFKGDGGVCVADTNTCNNCDEHATCVRADGGSVCRCVSGYTGDGMTCVSTANPCENGGGCGANATCTVTGSTRSCACNEGYTGNGFTCTPISGDPCASNECALDATCHASGSSYTCTCNEGYTGSGFICTPIGNNPCASNDCDAHATCHISGSTYTCTCNQGYTGDGFSCTAVSSGGLVGDTCTASTAQGNCASGEVCQPLTLTSGATANICIIDSCTSNGTCGSTAGRGNICVGGDPGFCVGGCSTSADCRASGFTCWSEFATSGNIENFCWEDCRSAPQATCGYYASCNAGGGCVHRECTSNSNCLTNQVCAIGAGLCVSNCTRGGSASCTGGSTCNSSNGLCEFSAYQNCGSQTGVCKSGLICIRFGETDSTAICLQDCGSGTAGTCTVAPSGQQCNVDLTGGGKTCSLPCTAGVTTCPSGTTCQTLGSLSICAP